MVTSTYTGSFNAGLCTRILVPVSVARPYLFVFTIDGNLDVILELSSNGIQVPCREVTATAYTEKAPLAAHPFSHLLLAYIGLVLFLPSVDRMLGRTRTAFSSIATRSSNPKAPEKMRTFD